MADRSSDSRVGTEVSGPAVRAALFDTFGTVVDWRSGIADHVRIWLARNAPDRLDIDPLTFADQWRARYQPSMEPIRRGERAFTRLDVLHRESVEALLAEHGIDAAATELDSLTLAWHALPPWPDSVAGIASIRATAIVAPLSNGNISLLLEMAKHAGIEWDAILGAEVVQAYKPTPESYLRTADVLGLTPGECILVAAHNDDLRAADACGFRTAFVRRPHEHGPKQTADTEATGDWTYAVDSLVELADRMGPGTPWTPRAPGVTLEP